VQTLLRPSFVVQYASYCSLKVVATSVQLVFSFVAEKLHVCCGILQQVVATVSFSCDVTFTHSAIFRLRRCDTVLWVHFFHNSVAKSWVFWVLCSAMGFLLLVSLLVTEKLAKTTNTFQSPL